MTTRKATKTLTADLGAMVGQRGLKASGGFINEEFQTELRGPLGARTYREMVDNESTIGAVTFAITSLIRQAEWTVQAADDSDAAEEGKVFVEECLADMAETFEAVIAEACSMFVYGFAPMEFTLKHRSGTSTDRMKSSRHSDGKIGIASIALRAQTTIPRWALDPSTQEVTGVYQQPETGPEVLIPLEKVLLFRTTEERGNPQGRSILRSAYRSWYFKKRIEEIEAIGVERDLAGMPVVGIPSRYFAKDADPADRAVLAVFQSLVTSIRRDKNEGIVMPMEFDARGHALFELKLLSTAGSRAFDTTKIIDRYSKAMATSVLADFIFLGQQAVGSFALSSDKTALFAVALGAFTKGMAAVLNRNLLPVLWEVNGFDPETMPSINCADLENPNLGELASFLSSLASAGATVFPDRELENHLRKLAGLPLAPEDDGGLDEDPSGGRMPGDEDAEASALRPGVTFENDLDDA